jgi:hypothetical protein
VARADKFGAKGSATLVSAMPPTIPALFRILMGPGR